MSKSPKLRLNRNMRIQTKLFSGLFLLVLVGAIVGYLATAGTLTTSKNFIGIIDNNVPRVVSLLQLKNSSSEIETNIADYSWASNNRSQQADKATDVKHNLLASLENLQDAQKDYARYVKSSGTKLDTDKLNTATDAVVQAASDLASAREQQAPAAVVDTIETKLQEAIKNLTSISDHIIDIQIHELNIQRAQADASARKLVQRNISFQFLAFGLAICIGLIMTRIIARPLIKLRKGADKIASGKLDERIEVTSRDEIGQLATAFNDMSHKLKSTYQELADEKASVEKQVIERTEQVHEEQAKLKASIESLNIGFVMIDNNNTIVLTNRAISDITGVEDRAWTLQDLSKYFHKDSGQGEDPLAMLDKIRSEGKSQYIDKVAVGEKIVRIFIAPVAYRRDSLGFVVLIEDITEQEIISRSKDEFFSIASHELRTPLTAIRGNAGMLIDMFSDTMKKEGMDEMVQDIHISSLRLIDIVNDFLDVSRLEQGKVSFEYSEVAIDSIIEKVMYEMVAVLKEKHLKLDFNRKTLGQLPKVWADPNRLKQIVYNLVGNAAKFTEEGGIFVDASVESGFVKVKVTDTGRGINPEGQKLLFRKFQQTGSSLITRDTTRGTGLGLYISKMLTESMGGIIALDNSEEGKGSTFSFTLPIVSDANHQSLPKQTTGNTNSTTGLSAVKTVQDVADLLITPEHAKPANSSAAVKPSGKLMVVEDDPYVIRLYQRIFKASDLELKTVINGKEALGAAEAFKPDIILMDIMMPVMNGLDALSGLKANPATKDIPVIMLSNFGEEDTVKSAYQKGAIGYMIKSDFSPEQILDEVNKKIHP